ncbi:MAG: tail fiber domain-containing protein, partial [Patescibacteria group bacterium]|nr:tail fiber domain-containing protein [Patescibacteria group bacterium]
QNSGGVITNAYGIFIADSIKTGTITHDWGLYQAGTTSKNFFGSEVRIGSGATGAQLLDVGDDIRIGTGTTGCVEDRDGTVIAGTCSSDERFKKNIQDFRSVLSVFKDLRIVTYNWKSKEFPHRQWGTQRELGVLAQNIQKIFPELVTHDETGFLRVNYSALPIIALQGIKEAAKEIQLIKDMLTTNSTITPNMTTTNTIFSYENGNLQLHIPSQSANIQFSIANQNNVFASIHSDGTVTFNGIVIAKDIVTKDGSINNALKQLSNEVDTIRTLSYDLDRKLSQMHESSSSSNQDFLSNIEATQSSSGQNINELLTFDNPVLFTKSLTVENHAFFYDLSIQKNLTIGGVVAVTGRGIESLEPTLYIEPQRLSALNMLNGLLVLNPSGVVQVSGNMIIDGILNLTTILPKEKELIIDLSNNNKNSPEEGSSFIVRTQKNPDTLKITSNGIITIGTDIISSGSATIEKINIKSQKAEHASVGKSMIPQGQKSVTIQTTALTKDSLIHITPLSSTKNNVVYVESLSIDETCTEQNACTHSFTVAIDTPIDQSIPFNWWIIN